MVRILRLRRHVADLRYVQDLSALAASFSVCERTIRRDLAVLEEAHEFVPRYRVNPE